MCDENLKVIVTVTAASPEKDAAGLPRRIFEEKMPRYANNHASSAWEVLPFDIIICFFG